MDTNTADPFLLRRANAAELFLIRHGDAIPEADEIIPSGVYNNLPLSKIGREQAQALAERLKDTHFDAAYSSPLLRCQQTAAPLLDSLKLPLTIVEEIKEVRLVGNFLIPTLKEGEDLTGLSKALQDRQREITRKAAIAGSWDVIEESEPSKDFRKRIVTGIDTIARQHIGQRVIVFAHGGTINAYAAEALGLERDFFFPCANTSITMFHVNGDQRVMFIMNDVAHLKLQ
jgi:broad specificity phosphatase PhoE